MRSRPPEPAALMRPSGARTRADRSQQRHPTGSVSTVGQTEPEHRWAIIETSPDANRSSLFDGDLESRILSSGEETLRRHGPSKEVPAMSCCIAARGW